MFDHMREGGDEKEIVVKNDLKDSRRFFCIVLLTTALASLNRLRFSNVGCLLNWVIRWFLCWMAKAQSGFHQETRFRVLWVDDWGMRVSAEVNCIDPLTI